MLSRYVAVRRGRLGVVDDIIGLAPSSHGTTNPLAGPAGSVRLHRVRRAAGRLGVHAQGQRAAARGARAGLVHGAHHHPRRGRHALPVAGAGRRPRHQRDPPGPCPADPFEHVTIVGDPVALQWAVNALERPGAANPDFVPDCTGADLRPRPRRPARARPAGRRRRARRCASRSAAARPRSSARRAGIRSRARARRRRLRRAARAAPRAPRRCYGARTFRVRGGQDPHRARARQGKARAACQRRGRCCRGRAAGSPVASRRYRLR